MDVTLLCHLTFREVFGISIHHLILEGTDVKLDHRLPHIDNVQISILVLKLLIDVS